MSIYKDIEELLNAELISDNQAENIRAYYRNKESQSGSKLFTVFGILGAVLIGLGLILIIAHNWDELSRLTKSIFAFIPLLIGQILCGYTLIKKQDRVVWREASTGFLFLTVGASISLVSQIYNISGNLSSFLLTWVLICIPLVYIMKSSLTSLFCIVGITYYACETGYGNQAFVMPYLYILMLLTILPHYYQLYKKRPESNWMIHHNWLIPISILITLGSFSDKHDEWMFIAYFSLFACLYILGNRSFFNQQKTENNAYKILGSLGSIALLLVLSFDWFWDELRGKTFHFNELIVSPEFIVSASLTVLAALLLYLQQRKSKQLSIKPISLVFLFFILAFVSGLSSPIAMVLINFYVFVIGIFTIREGLKKDHLGILNFGLLIIIALGTCRFFDESLSFVIRGILFVLVGLGFFATNYVMLKKEKMDRKYKRLSVFIFVALLQFYIPAKMILDNEAVLESGVAYKFKTAPVDPTDPFRGKYVTLRYKDNRIRVENKNDWTRDEEIFVVLTKDEAGFAKIKSILKKAPKFKADYFKAKIAYVSSTSSNQVWIDYPFNRFYMEENKAKAAEDLYRKSQTDASKPAYALVRIKSGESVLQDVLIDGVSIKDIDVNAL